MPQLEKNKQSFPKWHAKYTEQETGNRQLAELIIEIKLLSQGSKRKETNLLTEGPVTDQSGGANLCLPICI